MEWEAAERVQKNSSGQYRAFVGGEWVPVEKAQKSASGQYRVIRVNGNETKPQYKVDDDFMRRTAISATRAKHPILAGAMDFGSGALGMTRGALNAVTDPRWNELRAQVGAPLGQENAGDRLLPTDFVDKDSGSYMAGALADPLAWGTGLEAAKLIPYAKVLGGGAMNALKATGQNIAGGAIPGAIIGGTSEDGSVGSGATLGAALNLIVPPAFRMAGTAISKAWTTASSKYKAQAILKGVLGPDLAKFRAVISRSPAGQSAAQAASAIDNDLLNALDDLVRRMDKTGYFKGLNETQVADVVDGLAKYAGGRNQTAIRRAVEQSTKNLGLATEPVAQEALRAANVGGRAMRRVGRLEDESARLGASASGRVQDVRRLEGARETAEGIARTGRMNQGGEAVPVLGQEGLQIGSGPPFSRGTELVNVAERGSQAAADESLVLGAASRGAKEKAAKITADLAQRGLKPLDTGRLTGKLRGMLRDPAVGPATPNERALSLVADKIEEWTQKNGGVIDARALRTIRINAVNDAIEGLMGGADPKTKAKTAAGLLAKVKPAIDDAIEDAGGKGWKSYLFDYERGKRLIDRQKMAGKALRMFEKDPKKLESLAEGNEPDLVKKAFKTEYDLGVAMGTKIRAGGKEVSIPGPRPIEDAAALAKRTRTMREGASRGEAAMVDVLKEHKASWILPNWINRSVAVTNRALEEMEFRVNKRTFAALSNAMRSGADANKIINLAPPEERLAVIKALSDAQDSPKTRAFLTGLVNSVEQGE